jgi:hypothetical protein
VVAVSDLAGRVGGHRREIRNCILGSEEMVCSPILRAELKSAPVRTGSPRKPDAAAARTAGGAAAVGRPPSTCAKRGAAALERTGISAGGRGLLDAAWFACMDPSSDCSHSATRLGNHHDGSVFRAGWRDGTAPQQERNWMQHPAMAPPSMSACLVQSPRRCDDPEFSTTVRLAAVSPTPRPSRRPCADRGSRPASAQYHGQSAAS